MIYSVSGPVLSTGPDFVVISVGGLGMRIEVSPLEAGDLSSMFGKDATLHTSLIVREDSLTLFGFRTEDERRTFEILMTVSGIGPRLAQGALGALGAEGLRSAVAAQDLTALQKISGVGKKTAQRMVLEIGDKLGPPAAPTPGGFDATESQIRQAVEAGLEQLGWPRAVAKRAVESLEGSYADTESMLRAALGHIGSGRG